MTVKSKSKSNGWADKVNATLYGKNRHRKKKVAKTRQKRVTFREKQTKYDLKTPQNAENDMLTQKVQKIRFFGQSNCAPLNIVFSMPCA
jgi:hypothetical protein